MNTQKEHAAYHRRWTGPTVTITLFICAIVWLGHLASGTRSRFITIDQHGFRLNGKPFFPLAVNYIATLRAHGDSLWISPSLDYTSHVPSMPNDRRSDLLALKADMELIHDMGFNIVRIVGFTDLLYERDSALIMGRNTLHADTTVWLGKEGAYHTYLNAIGELLATVRDAGLHAIILTQVRPGRPLTEEHFARIADRFVNDTTILAYDLFNEPLYFDRPERPKREAWDILQHWRALFDRHAPNQLYTLGLTGIRETFEFDPNMLGVDFISFHPYEYEPEQVRNEMRWYHNNVDVPWIIGETSIPADNDSVPYEDQRLFAQKTLLQSRACGAMGYSWWQYQDVKWNRFHADYMGVVNRQGRTRTTKSGLQVKGTVKPMAEAIKHFDPWANAGECLCLPNYLNYSNNNVSMITGRLVDADGHPINEGTIIAWNEFWTSSFHTTSRADGRFEVRGPFYFNHWMTSATRWSMERGDCSPNAFRRGADGIPVYELGDIVLERLSFIQ